MRVRSCWWLAAVVRAPQAEALKAAALAAAMVEVMGVEATAAEERDAGHGEAATWVAAASEGEETAARVVGVHREGPRAAARAAWVAGARPGSNRCNRSREPTTRRNRERAARRCTSGSCRLGGKARGAGTYWMCTV